VAPTRALALVIVTACAAGGAQAAEAKLSFTRADGSVIHFSAKPRVWCGPWAQDVATPAIHVAVRGHKRHWDLSAVRRDAKPRKRFKFPLDFVFDKPHGVQLFVADAPNEASTAQEESSGSMTFSRVSCRHGGVVAFSIDAVVGSELSNEPAISVSGIFRGRVSARGLSSGAGHRGASTSAP
jgi:hypothetical protein